MTYTTEQLQVMSDFELGKALAVMVGKTIADEQYFHYGDRDENVVLLFPQGESFNINNPSDIMPLAFERGISLLYWEEEKSYEARYKLKFYQNELASWGFRSDWECNFEHTNPLRAIACLLLLIGE